MAVEEDRLVLELRIHGVNNTPPSGLLDLPQYSLRQVAGDDRAAFWLADPETNPSEGARGHIPTGIRREAYSWGALVRTESKSGSRGRALMLLLQVLALPFSIGNAAIWTRQLTDGDQEGGPRRRAWLTAGAARVFGLALTLLFTTTAVTIAVEVGALQCGISGGCSTWFWDVLWGTLQSVPGADAFLTPSRVLAVFALVPVLTVWVLVWFARISRNRYDTLHVRPTAAGRAAREEIRSTDATGRTAESNPQRRALLARPAFWTNQITGRLARIHFAAAIALTTVQVALHLVALEDAPLWHLVVLGAGGVILGASAIAVAVLPTMTTTPAAPEGPPWTGALTLWLLGAAVSTFVALVALLVAQPQLALPPTGGLSGGELPPLLIVSVAAIIALSGVAWRPRDARPGTAWLGCAPTVFMTFSLGLGVLTSSVMIALAAALLTGWRGPEGLAVGAVSRAGIQIPDVFLAGGGLIAVALAISLLALASFLLPRKLLAERAQAWNAKDVAELLADRAQKRAAWEAAERLVHREQERDAKLVERLDDDAKEREAKLIERLTTLLGRRRRRAALVHLVEPASAVVAGLMGVAIATALAWVWVGIGTPHPLTAVVGASGSIWGIPIVDVLTITPWVVTAVGAVLTVVVALAVLRREPNLFAIVWDVTCFLPRTAQPFGPPCYAERAVPDIAARLDDWLSGRPERRAVLAAHSMGGMIAVAALGLLSATASDPTVLGRVSLLTFGVQLRTYFGRMMPELVGPAVLGTYPARAPRPWQADPWASDVLDDDGRPWSSPLDAGPVARLRGGLLGEDGVPWLNLWRLSDYLGFPVVAGRSSFHRGDVGYDNGVDRYAQEIDLTISPPIVVTHNDYIRVPAYQDALLELLHQPEPAAAADAAAGPGGRDAAGLPARVH